MGVEKEGKKDKYFNCKRICFQNIKVDKHLRLITNKPQIKMHLIYSCFIFIEGFPGSRF